MPSPHIFTVPPGQPVAGLAATYVLKTVPTVRLPKALLLVPNRRSAVILRDAFREAAQGKPLLLPRILPLANLQDELPLLLEHNALEAIAALPAAMPDWQRLCLLAAQVRSFERVRRGEVTLEQALRLAQDLATLQDTFTRANQPLAMERLRGLITGDFAEHWQQSLSFLSIVAELWPDIEREQGMITREARQRLVTELLIDHWRASPPPYPVFVIGSTASQPTTAKLMKTVANMEQGVVILPGLEAGSDWETIRPGHPQFHLKAFLEHCDVPPAELSLLAPAVPTAAVWHAALGAFESWRKQPGIIHDHVRLIACQHAEEEARVIALLMREAAESPGRRTALVTPDETLMGRVAAQLNHYGITADRLAAGTLATTQTGSLLTCLMEAINTPERMLPLLNFLRHELIAIGEPDAWQRWLAAAEPSFRGVMTSRAGDMPVIPSLLASHPATAGVKNLIRECSMLSRRPLKASEWVKKLTALLKPITTQAGSGQEAVTEALHELADTDMLGPLDSEGFSALLKRQLETSWREVSPNAHSNLFLLTPVEARLMHFDRVILGGMQSTLWPGLAAPGPWLNLSQQQTLGLPAAQEHVSLMAHDLLMLGSMKEVFLTYALREGGAPAQCSPFVERLLTFLAMQGVEEEALKAPHYLDFARALYAAEQFSPATPPKPAPVAAARPKRLRVTALEKLFTDPYSIYAESVLGLKALQDIDAEPEAKDFGTIAHRAIQKLSAHWDVVRKPASEATITQIAGIALEDFSHRPHVQLFWRNRLLAALRFVNTREAERRRSATSVQSEMPVEKEITLTSGAKLTLHGRVDRLEETGEGAVIADYKTGTIASKKDMEEGREKAVQLLAYALLLTESGQKVAAVEYWQLPHGRREGEVLTTPLNMVEGLLPALRAALAKMLEEGTPFLARPLAANERFDNDYDGISRYDEWAS